MILHHDHVDLDYDECVGVTCCDVHQDTKAAMGVIV
jgi:phosphate acetyltransferase